MIHDVADHTAAFAGALSGDLDQPDDRMGPRAEKRYDMRLRLAPKDRDLLKKIRKDLDLSAADVMRSALRELGLKLGYRPRTPRGSE